METLIDENECKLIAIEEKQILVWIIRANAMPPDSS
jgi:hypothetical protein